jgi:CO/xanthine dehydrogenase FAD-binding subunit
LKYGNLSHCMTVLTPQRLDGALAALAGDPSLSVVAGGTDLMVDLNAGRRHPARLLSLRHVDELRRWHRAGDELVIGAGVTYTTLLDPTLTALAPGLAQAARTVGSPQIRNTGTIGGNLATASPAGDTLPVLAALDAVVELASADERRTVPFDDFVTGPKTNALQPGELVVAVRIPVISGPQEYLKIGVRNAMVIAVASCALVVDWSRRQVGCAFGSVGPRPMRDRRAEGWLAGEIDWDGRRARSASAAERFGRWMADAVTPIDDHRATAAYRREATAVLARRAVERVLA